MLFSFCVIMLLMLCSYILFSLVFKIYLTSTLTGMMTLSLSR